VGRIIELAPIRDRDRPESGRVERLKRLIQQGLYQPDPEAVAEAMLQQADKPPSWDAPGQP